MSHTGWGNQGPQDAPGPPSPGLTAGPPGAGRPPYGGPPGWGWGPPPPPPPPQPGVIPLAPLGVDAVYSGAFATMRRYAKPLFGVLALAYALLAALIVGSLTVAYLSVGDELDIRRRAERGQRLAGLGASAGRSSSPSLIAGAVCVLATIVVNSFVSAAGPAVLERRGARAARLTLRGPLAAGLGTDAVRARR